MAAGLVVFHHATLFWARETGQWSGFWPGGAAGVDIFFVISGFVMYYTACDQRGAREAGVFLERRFLRLAPMYWLMTVLFTAEYVLVYYEPQLRTHGEVWTKLTVPWLISSIVLIPYSHGGFFGPIVSVGWTLSIECLFYLLFAVAILLPIDKRLFLSVALVAGAIYGWNPPQTRPVALTLIGPMLLEFLAGVFIAWICLRFQRVNGTWWIAASAVALLLLMTPHFPHFPQGYSARVRVLTWGIPAIFIVAGVTFSEGHIAWPKWLLLLGDASYSLYLVHNLVLDTVFRFCEWAGVFRHVTKPVEIALASVCTILSVGVAVPLYLRIERPMNEYLRKRFLRGSRPLQAHAASV